MPAGQSEVDKALEGPNDWRSTGDAVAESDRGGEVFQ
jgi:hypothetical protein